VICCAVQRSVIIGGSWDVVSAHRIAGTKALSFQSRLENTNKPAGDLNKTSARALIACSGCVDQYPALNWLP
jgi:hypothetical protein